MQRSRSPSESRGRTGTIASCIREWWAQWWCIDKTFSFFERIFREAMAEEPEGCVGEYPSLRQWREPSTMDMNVDMEQVAEIEDALGACDELHAVLARLKRL